MTDSIQFMSAESADAINRPMFTIKNYDMIDYEALSPAITGTRKRQLEEDGTPKR